MHLHMMLKPAANVIFMVLVFNFNTDVHNVP